MKSVLITYFVHGTTIDNEQHKATGWNPGELSRLGTQQCKDLKSMIDVSEFDVIFCSDLKRAIDSAELTFGDAGIEIIQDKRLRECNYGDLNGGDSKLVKVDMPGRITTPFPHGESYKDVEKRMRSFLNDVAKKYEEKHVAIMAHEGPQLALEVITKGRTWEQAINENWRNKKPKEWQPGWKYSYKVLK